MENDFEVENSMTTGFSGGNAAMSKDAFPTNEEENSSMAGFDKIPNKDGANPQQSLMVDPNQFRMAFGDATNRFDSPQLKKKRRSLGRRVSFAATAHVRMFEKEVESEPESPTNNNLMTLLDSNPFAQTSFRSFDDVFGITEAAAAAAAATLTPTAPSPLRPLSRTAAGQQLPQVFSPMAPKVVRDDSALENPADNNVFSGEYDENASDDTALSNAENHLENAFMSVVEDEVDVEVQITTKSSSTEKSDISFVSNGSFEVNVKDEQSSFSSYYSSDEQQSPGRDMEMTNCVGGILGDLARPSEENTTMDLTLCVGKILDEMALPPAAEEVTMDLTTCIGGILGQQAKPEDTASAAPATMAYDQQQHSLKALESGESPVVSPFTIVSRAKSPLVRAISRQECQDGDHQGSENGSSDDKEEAGDDDMEMTVCVKDINIRQQQRRQSHSKRRSLVAAPASPSPFLVQSPASRTFATITADNNDVNLSFIENVDRPAAFDFTMSPAPARVTADDEKTAADMFKEFIKSDQDSPIRPELVVSEGRPPKIPAISADSAAAVALADSVMASPNPMVLRASLKDFLTETGVRFLDNLSTLARRETTGRPRDSDIITPAKQAYIQSALVPEDDALETGCADLVESIMKQREILGHYENRFNHTPPQAYYELSQAVTDSDRSIILHKLKTLKSVARLIAKQSWYEWRQHLEEPLGNVLDKNLADMRAEYTLLSDDKQQIEQIGANLPDMVTELRNQVQVLRHRRDTYESTDWEQADALERAIAQQNDKLGSLGKDLNSLVKQESELRRAIDQAIAEKQVIQKKIDAAREACNASQEYSDLVLQELKSTHAMHTALNGWRFVQIRPESVTIEYLRNGPVQVQFTLANPGNGEKASHHAQPVVTSVMIDSSKAKTKMVQYASLVIKPTFQKSLPKTLLAIVSQLDRLVLLDQDLAVIGYRSCTAEILHPFNDASVSAIPLTLSFANYDVCYAFKVVCSVWPTSVRLDNVEYEHARISRQEIVETVESAMARPGFHPIRRIVSALTDKLSE